MKVSLCQVVLVMLRVLVLEKYNKLQPLAFLFLFLWII